MESLPHELKEIILAILPMPDKRNLIRCTKELGGINIKCYEDEFIKMIPNTRFLCDNAPPISITTKIEQYTLEMIYYGYDKLIPERYICNKNELLYKYYELYFYCAANNYVGIAKILINCNKSCTDQITYGAAYAGHLELLKWAHKNGCHCNSSTCAYAAKNGHLEILKWAHENGCSWDSMTCAYAAFNGHLEVLKWVRNNGCGWDSGTCTYAAANGNLEVLKWARDNGCDWDSMTCTAAASNGHLEVLKWARDNGCNWDRDTYMAAADNGRVGIRF